MHPKAGAKLAVDHVCPSAVSSLSCKGNLRTSNLMHGTSFCLQNFCPCAAIGPGKQPVKLTSSPQRRQYLLQVHSHAAPWLLSLSHACGTHAHSSGTIVPTCRDNSPVTLSMSHEAHGLHREFHGFPVTNLWPSVACHLALLSIRAREDSNQLVTGA